MSRTTGRFLMLALAVGLAMPQFARGAQPAKPAAESSRFDAYTQPDGGSYFALSLMPQVALPAAEQSDVVVLFDTAASEMGPYREKGLEVLRGLLKTLSDKDRVKLVAVDEKAIPLTTAFVSPRGPEIQAAIEKLQRRVPLGATDMDATLKGAIDSFKDASAGAHAAVFIGDGRGNANPADMNVPALIDGLVCSKISVYSFAVGPAQNIQSLAALANQTGGTVAIDGEQMVGTEAGAMLAKSLHEPVIWPTDRKLPASLTDVYPTKTPPLRTDRDTILLGKGSADGNFDVNIKGESGGKPVDMQWSVKASKPNDDNAFLAQWVDFAKADGGYSLPTVGSEGLWEARRVANLNAHSLGQLGRQAAAAGNMKQASQFANEAVRRDPNDANALVLKQSLDQKSMRLASAENSAGAATDIPPPPEASEGNLLDSVEQTQKVIQQKVMTDATVQMNHARDMLSSDPQRVLDEMKLLLDRIWQVQELTTEQRADLRGRITSLLEQANQRRAEKEVADVERARNAAVAQDKIRVLDDLDRRDTQLKGLVDRFDALLEQGYQNFDQVNNESMVAAEKDAGQEFAKIAVNPFGREPSAATTMSRFALLTRYQAEDMAVRDAAARNFMDELHLVDVSHIPFPDSPPIVYPDAAFWKKITKDRKKYASVDLAGSKPAEAKILKELDEPTKLEFAETPLKDVLDYIQTKHHIPVQFDNEALKTASIDPSTLVVTRTLNDLSLRSALKLILQDFQLTYIIENEVLLITTKEKADTHLVTKVYPVADLVLPIQSTQVNPFQMGGGLGGGGIGGGGGGIGGFGGGGGGIGGFGGGGGGLGGGGLGGGGLLGGGGFNMPPEEGRKILPAPGTGGPLDVGDDDSHTGAAKPDDKSSQPLKLKVGKPTVPTATSAGVTASKTDRTAATSTSAGASSSATSAKAESTPKVESLRTADNADPEKFWNDFFATQKEPDGKNAAAMASLRDANIRATAKELMGKHKFAEVQAMLNGALRNGYAQPWMYEALALAMQANDQPKEEIERALMSAVEFANNATDLMNVAVYMARIGLDERALKLLRQASALEPYRHEPYMHGLRIAQRLNDANGIRWASLGVLSHAWTSDKKEVVDSAKYAALGLREQLMKDGRTKEAEEFTKALDEAQQRDCKVVVTWNGNADIDLTVEEPTGAMCTFRNPQTTGGGVLQTESYAKMKTPGSDGSSEYSESYILPQGFTGQY
ncbi:MAG TPA: hypothetical protein VGJ15_13105, partial [Pirellulales bacterium]